MKFFLASATVVACLSSVCLAAGPANAQATGAAQPAASRKADSGIRVIDIERAFKQHLRYNAQIEELKDVAKQMEAETNREKASIIEQEKDLPNLKSGTDQRKAADEAVLRRKTELAARTRMKQQELLEKEAKIYYFTYKEIQDEVTEYCRQTGVSIVLQYSSEKVDPQNRMSIMKAMGNPVVHHVGIDITDQILHYLNQGYQPAKKAEQAQRPVTGDVPRGPTR